MPPKRKLFCSCKKHGEYCGNHRVHRTDGKKIRMEVIRSLISSGALSDRALYRCHKCAEHAEKNLLENKKINGMKHLFSDVYKFNLSRHISFK